MTSVYSLSQIVGGLVLGALSDRAVSRRLVLLVSFLGSALSYGMIGLSSSLNMLLVGRVIVGLVKQVCTRVFMFVVFFSLSPCGYESLPVGLCRCVLLAWYCCYVLAIGGHIVFGVVSGTDDGKVGIQNTGTSYC